MVSHRAGFGNGHFTLVQYLSAFWLLLFLFLFLPPPVFLFASSFFFFFFFSSLFLLLLCGVCSSLLLVRLLFQLLGGRDGRLRFQLLGGLGSFGPSFAALWAFYSLKRLAQAWLSSSCSSCVSGFLVLLAFFFEAVWVAILAHLAPIWAPCWKLFRSILAPCGPICALRDAKGPTRAKTWSMLVAFGVHLGASGRLLGPFGRALALLFAVFFSLVFQTCFQVPLLLHFLLFLSIFCTIWVYVVCCCAVSWRVVSWYVAKNALSAETPEMLYFTIFQRHSGPLWATFSGPFASFWLLFPPCCCPFRVKSAP